MVFAKTSRMALILVTAMAASFSSFTPAFANIYYNLNLYIDPITLTGLLETDGTLGALSPRDILSFDITASSVGFGIIFQPYDTIVYGQGDDLFATTNKITFDYDANDGGYLIFQFSSGVDSGEYYWCNATGGQNTCAPGISLVTIPPTAAFASPTGTVVHGTVPEPSTWAMMLLGFAGLGLAGYQASRGAATAA